MEFTETGQTKMSGDVLKTLAGYDEKVTAEYHDLIKNHEE